jgi:hypothetical protein
MHLKATRVCECSLDSSEEKQGSVAGFWEHGNKSSCSMKAEECLARLSGYQLFKMDSTTLNQSLNETINGTHEGKRQLEKLRGR